MYLDFYGFKEKPFSLLPDPEYLFLSTKHKAALAHMDFGLTDQTGFILITGDVGTGKTTLLKHLVRNLDEQIQVAMVFNTRVSSLELIQMILREFDLDENPKGKGQCYRALYDFLLDQYGQGNRCLLIIDEAQNLSPQTLEEVRMLSNLNEGKNNLLQVILAGQPALKIKLERKNLRQVAQRITIDFILEPLGPDETRDYILYRMGVAGREAGDDLFTPKVHEQIYQASQGIPRLINILCDGALVYGFADELKTIDADVIHEVLADKKIRGQFFGQMAMTEETPESGAIGSLTRRVEALSKRVEHLEKRFEEFQDQRKDETIHKLEKLLADETEAARNAIRECGQKDMIVKGLRRRIENLEQQLRAQWQDRAKQRTEEP
jgi:type II secretory pathway predicted ATPase ExeA